MPSRYCHHVRVTVFQPFRMATLARDRPGFCRRPPRWPSGDGRMAERLRAILIAVAFTGDWLLVVVTLAELAVSAAEAIRACLPGAERWRFVDPLVLVGDACARTELSGAPRHGIWAHSAHGRSWDGVCCLGVVGKVCGRTTTRDNRLAKRGALCWIAAHDRIRTAMACARHGHAAGVVAGGGGAARSCRGAASSGDEH